MKTKQHHISLAMDKKKLFAKAFLVLCESEAIKRDISKTSWRNDNVTII